MLDGQDHIRFALEFLGSSLSLPPAEDCFQTIELTLIIYKSWLGLSCSASWQLAIPEHFADNKQQFYQIIIRQLSVLFEDRAAPSTGPRV